VEKHVISKQFSNWRAITLKLFTVVINLVSKYARVLVMASPINLSYNSCGQGPSLAHNSKTKGK
jgi:hypothetical protein